MFFKKKEKLVLPHQAINKPLLISNNFADFLISASMQGANLKALFGEEKKELSNTHNEHNKLAITLYNS